jgi:hypothetical protein
MIHCVDAYRFDTNFVFFSEVTAKDPYVLEVFDLTETKPSCMADPANGVYLRLGLCEQHLSSNFLFCSQTAGVLHHVSFTTCFDLCGHHQVET